MARCRTCLLKTRWSAGRAASEKTTRQSLLRRAVHLEVGGGKVAELCLRERPVGTVRYAAELGYEATMVKDATADYSDREMRGTLEVRLPNYASAIVTTEESWRRSLPS